MEFYPAQRAFALSLVNCFNSQRDGILRANSAIPKTAASGFNSQRDGILRKCEIIKRPILFVSIPNGMEFYAKVEALEKENAERFNSQRDGILPFKWIFWLWSFVVSIPNGMEFYVERKQNQASGSAFQFPTGWNSTNYSLKRGELLVRFNSQRDGILPDEDDAYWINFIKFLFPSGWNSTLLARVFLFPNYVSIPNGMEFYCEYLSKTTLSILFQFPTGWNSTDSWRKFLRQQILFQFPTGWNSTISQSIAIWPIVSFNSQRDGILPEA